MKYSPEFFNAPDKNAQMNRIILGLSETVRQRGLLIHKTESSPEETLNPSAGSDKVAEGIFRLVYEHGLVINRDDTTLPQLPPDGEQGAELPRNSGGNSGGGALLLT